MFLFAQAVGRYVFARSGRWRADGVVNVYAAKYQIVHTIPDLACNVILSACMGCTTGYTFFQLALHLAGCRIAVRYQGEFVASSTRYCALNGDTFSAVLWGHVFVWLSDEATHKASYW